MNDIMGQCEFTKKGVCRKHGVKGDRREVTTKTWKKKKYGYRGGGQKN